MAYYVWDPEKNERLKRERGIAFEDVIFHIQGGDAVDVFEHPNQQRYPGQFVIVVVVERYAYLVPYVENGEEVFLKTIIPSRSATKQYLGDTDE